MITIWNAVKHKIFQIKFLFWKSSFFLLFFSFFCYWYYCLNRLYEINSINNNNVFQYKIRKKLYFKIFIPKYLSIIIPVGTIYQNSVSHKIHFILNKKKISLITEWFDTIYRMSYACFFFDTLDVNLMKKIVASTVNQKTGKQSKLFLKQICNKYFFNKNIKSNSKNNKHVLNKKRYKINLHLKLNFIFKLRQKKLAYKCIIFLCMYFTFIWSTCMKLSRPLRYFHKEFF